MIHKNVTVHDPAIKFAIGKYITEMRFYIANSQDLFYLDGLSLNLDLGLLGYVVYDSLDKIGDFQEKTFKQLYNNPSIDENLREKVRKRLEVSDIIC